MYEIIQSEKDFESVIDSKDTEAEAREYVSALNDMKKNEETQFYYKQSNSQTYHENNVFQQY